MKSSYFFKFQVFHFDLCSVTLMTISRSYIYETNHMVLFSFKTVFAQTKFIFNSIY